VLLRRLSFGMWGLTLAVLLLSGNNFSSSYLSCLIEPGSALGRIGLQPLLLGLAAAGLVACLTTEWVLRRMPVRGTGRLGD
jgi:hypothetical protein